MLDIQDSVPRKRAFIYGVGRWGVKKMEHKFEPFEPVLVRDYKYKENVWVCAFFSHYNEDEDGYSYICTGGGSWKFCIPYEGNEHLVGTCETPEEKKKLKFGDKVRVRHYQSDKWKKAIFVEMLVSGKPYNVITEEEKKVVCFELCKKGWDE